MKELLEFILKAIVNDKDAVKVEESTDETGQINLIASVAEEDMGRVIGKAGKVINSIRLIVKIPAIKEGKRVRVDVKEPTSSADSSAEAPAKAETPKAESAVDSQ